MTKLTFDYFLRESAKIKGFDYDLFSRSSRLILIIVLGPVFIFGKYILKKGGDSKEEKEVTPTQRLARMKKVYKKEK